MRAPRKKRISRRLLFVGLHGSEGVLTSRDMLSIHHVVARKILSSRVLPLCVVAREHTWVHPRGFPMIGGY